MPRDTGAAKGLSTEKSKYSRNLTIIFYTGTKRRNQIMAATATANGEASQVGKTKLPPGMVLGPDGKPCKVSILKRLNRFHAPLTLHFKVCTGFKAWSASQGKSKPRPPPIAPTTTTAASIIPLVSSEIDSRKDCPADVERLGRHTWTFLHTSAAYYPDQPSPKHQSSMLSLLTALPTLYPCSHCAGELGDYMKLHPPVEAVKAKSALELWLCQVHNDVNQKLGKEAFDCDKVNERWRDGPSDGRCD